MNAIRAVVLGYLLRGPLGGQAWHNLQYVIGLAALGHDVYYIEDSDVPWDDNGIETCYNPSSDRMEADPSYGLSFAATAFNRVGMSDRWCYYDAHSSRWLGPLSHRVTEICSSADVLLNVGAVNPLRPWFEHIPVRVLIDTDPTFVQIRHLQNPAARDLAARHNRFFSFGENIGSTASIPDDGFNWMTTRQPIVLDCWPVTRGSSRGKFTSVMNWQSYAAAEHDGRIYGMKSMSFDPYLDLPQRVGPLFELAAGGDPPMNLGETGWTVTNPLEVTRDPWTYQLYLQQSKAEFGIAKHGYVVSRSGWFSERTACYLACGRPALVQDTGFTDWLEAGQGVIAFSSPDEAVSGLDGINSRYSLHCEAARQMAEAYFDSKKVLDELLSQCSSVDQPES